MKKMMSKIALLPLRGMTEVAEKIKEYLEEISNDPEVDIIEPNLLRFTTGDAKAVLSESVRGLDVYILSDVGNYSITYNMHGFENHMSPDDHYQDLIRTISAIGGKASRINIISPLLYAARQDRRTQRESLDCAVALQHLFSIGAENIMAFDVHDDRVQNATPFMGFDKLMPTYQTLKSLKNSFDDIIFDEDHLIMVSPDFGGVGRNHIFSNELGLDLGMFYKRRSTTKFENGKYKVDVHKYIGPDVEGKDVLVVDDIIASGETMLDVIDQVKKMGAKRIFLAATFGFFTNGTSKFNAAYENGNLDAVFVTNASYCPEKVTNAPWYREIDVQKYIAYYIYSVNKGLSIATIINPHKKIQELIAHELI